MYATKIKDGSIWRARPFIDLTIKQKLFYMFMFDAGTNVTEEYLIEMSEVLSLDYHDFIESMLSWCSSDGDLPVYDSNWSSWLLGDIHDLLWEIKQNLPPEKEKEPYKYNY